VDAPGPDGAPTIVLLHALATTGYLSWYPVISELARSYRVVVLDQRWHGRGITSPTFRVEDCADDVAALLDVLGIERCIPVGYSLGGLVAQSVAHRHPDRVEGLVLCATARNFRGKRQEQLFFPLLSGAMLPLRPLVHRRVGRSTANLAALPSAVPTDKGWGLQEFRSTSAWSMPAVLNELGRFNSAPWVGEISTPTTVIVTTKDKTIPPHRQRKLAEAIPGAHVHELEGGHVSLVLRAKEFEHALVTALASVTARRHTTVAS
jgi:pimeloyl-ACP methyl ester carboxylesterase